MSDNIPKLSFMGVSVDFPYDNPYPAQRAIMAKSISAFVHSQNCLLESPTGTGKTLALLASSLAYQKYVNDTSPEPSLQIDTENSDNEEKSKSVRVYYTSRTHTQLNQVVSELKKLTSYSPQLCILGSRKILCLNEDAHKSGNVDEYCRKYHQVSNQCVYGKKPPIVPHSFRVGGDHQVFDIEDLKDHCREYYMCPYFVTRQMIKSSNLILAPYNYVLDEQIRGQIGIVLDNESDTRNSIIVFDEGHNIENSCRDVVSLVMPQKEIESVHLNLRQIVDHPTMRVLIGDSMYDSVCNLYHIVSKMLDWLNNHTKPEPKNGSKDQTYELKNDIVCALTLWGLYSSWNSTINDFNRVLELEKSQFKENTDTFPGFVLVFFRRLYITIKLIMSKSNAEKDYRLIIDFGNQEKTIKLLCMNPGLVFNPIAQSAHSVVISSGTLSPLSDFSVELQVDFQQTLSARHVIDSSQVLSMVISRLNSTDITSSHSTMKTQKDNIFKEIGYMFLRILKFIPDGVLLFLPSNSSKNGLIDVWRKESIFQRIYEIKPVFLIGSNKPSEDSEVYKSYTQSVLSGKGGFLIGVIRGRMSEGIDFSDEQARAVFVFGVPYPNFTEPDIALKREYNQNRIITVGNDVIKNKSDSWYSAQAFRAVAQAVGRCIRHQNDYGAIFLLDSRYSTEKKNLPKWMEMSIQDTTITDINTIESKVSNFFFSMHEKFPRSMNLRSRISDDHPLSLTCSLCGNRLLSSMNLPKHFDVSNSEFFKKFAGCESTVSYVAINKNTSQLLDIMKGDFEWNNDDGLGFVPLLCSRDNCKSNIGLLIDGSRSHNSKSMNEIWIIIDRVNVSQESLSTELANVLQNKVKK